MLMPWLKYFVASKILEDSVSIERKTYMKWRKLLHKESNMSSLEWNLCRNHYTWTLNISYECFVFPISISNIVVSVLKFILKLLVLSRNPCVTAYEMSKYEYILSVYNLYRYIVCLTCIEDKLLCYVLTYYVNCIGLFYWTSKKAEIFAK